MIFQIIHIRKTLNDMNDVKNDPLIFIAKQIFAIFGTWIAIVVLAEIVILALLGIASFSTWFGNPSGIAQFFFWVFSIGFTIEIALFIMIWKRIMRFLKRTQSDVKESYIDVSAE